MSSLTLIVGSADDLNDPFEKLDINELYYEFWEENFKDENTYLIRQERFPIRFFGRSKFGITQYLGSGKTLMGMHILSDTAYYGGNVAANLGLVWHNTGIPKEQWTSKINTMDDFAQLHDSDILLDDIKGTVENWNTKEASVTSTIANAGRKYNNNIIITAQREIMIPRDIRDMATEWIVPIIRVRDNTQRGADKTGMPIEMIGLKFDGSKTFIEMMPPIIHLGNLFQAYNTIQRAIGLKIEMPKKKEKKNIFVRN